MQTKSSPSQPSDLRYLKGVGPKRALALKKMGILTIHDLLYLFPRRYEDRSQFSKISELIIGQSATIRGEILSTQYKPIRRMPIFEISVGDDTGMVRILWFHQPYLKKIFHEGQEVIVYGKAELYKKQLQITSPEYEIIDENVEEVSHTGRITPIYPLTEGLFQKPLRKTIHDTVQKQLDQNIREFLPENFRNQHGFLELQEAIRQIHFPSSFEELEKARKRLVFDEFFIFEMILIRRMKALRAKYQAHALRQGKSLFDEFEKNLPFKLTNSQRGAILDLIESCEQTYPMNRLLQGDVGSGKTVVAAFALLLAQRNQKQGGFLVPTEILAEQHYKTLKTMLQPFEVSIGLLTSSIPPAKREKILAKLKRGEISILVGTHALLSEDVLFSDLAVLVIDEQHKFGVHQRSELLRTNPRPHQLVMTATPIPRTLALTVYGDLEISVMEERPQGRQPIQTYWITRKKQTRVLERILQKAQAGEQAYFVFPLIEETEKLDLRAATQEYDRLRKGIFRDLKMGILHGKTPSETREEMMRAFRENEIQILVTTSVIEVGVDNPNATMMVIENAERFGLSQLHQLRGRIGRGSLASECYLFGEPHTTEGQMRLRIMTKTQDGFLIAEEDLKLRGPGDFLGTRQSGAPLFHLANPAKDYEVLKFARAQAKALIERDALTLDPSWENLRQNLETWPVQY